MQLEAALVGAAARLAVRAGLLLPVGWFDLGWSGCLAGCLVGHHILETSDFFIYCYFCYAAFMFAETQRLTNGERYEARKPLLDSGCLLGWRVGWLLAGIGFHKISSM